MIDLIAAAGIGGLIGFGTCAVLTMGKVADLGDQRDEAISARASEILPLANASLARTAREQSAAAAHYSRLRLEAEDAHTRCADALETARNRIERALEQITPGANATLRRVEKILKGEI